MSTPPRNFTWERGPFTKCAKCGEDTFGFLSAGKRTITHRCSKCRYRIDDQLPEVDKKVLYFDQFAFSELFKIEAGTRRQDELTDFWQELHRLVRRVVLLQQAILPHSNIHSNETIVSPWPNELREAYEGIGGDLALLDTTSIQLQDIGEFASAFIEERGPNFDFAVDRVLNGQRNEWLDDMRITVNADYSRFADGIREGRDDVDKSIEGLMEHWRAKGYGFDEVLEIESKAYLQSRQSALLDFFQRSERAAQEGDIMSTINLSMSPIVQEFSLLRHLFLKAGAKEENLVERINQFWAWERNSEIPTGRILAYLFAGLAGQVAAGRKRPATASFMNDVNAISAYAPYVDAMFVDKECATILTQGRPAAELNYKARIFSLSNRGDLLTYLAEIEAAATTEVREMANLIYGID